MYPQSFHYHAPRNLDEAIGLLEEHSMDAKLLAGGHSLIPTMKLRLAGPGHLIDLKHLRSDLNYVRDEDGAVAIGGLTTHHALESSDVIRQHLPLLAETAEAIGDVQVRNVGTLGGSLAHADPAADYPATILALEAEIVAQGPDGRRTVPASDFFFGLFTTDLDPEEVLVEIRVPKLPRGTGGHYEKFPHPASGYAVCGVAAVVTKGDDGNVTRCRLGLTGVADVGYRATGVEDALEGQPWSDERVDAAVQSTADDVEPMGDYYASGEYRAQLARVYARRALRRAWANAG